MIIFKILPLFLCLALPDFAEGEAMPPKNTEPATVTNLADLPPMSKAPRSEDFVANLIDSKKSESIGSYSSGSLKNAVKFPASGTGFVMIRRKRERYFGNEAALNWLVQFGEVISQAGLRPVLVGDVSKREGGRVRKDHASHQNGLDIDIWFENPRRFNREGDKDPPTLVYKQKVNERFGARHLLLLEFAARSPLVERIFVNYAIKRALCDSVVGDRSWLYKIRPWWGHDSHFHVRLPCPKSSPNCVPQEPLDPQNETCGDEVEWFATHRKGQK